MGPFAARTMRRRFVRFAAFFAAIIAISTAVSCNKDTGPAVVDKPAYALSLGEIPVSFGEGEAITVSIPIITDAPDSEIELADVPAWINAYVKEGTVVLEIAENNTVDARSQTITVRLKDGSKSQRIEIVQDWHLVNGEGMVKFKDRAFKKAVLEAWDTNHDNDISPEEALAADAVEAVGKGIKDISGIESFLNIGKIDLRDNDIEDGSLTANHPYLHWLDLVGNKHLKTFDTRGCTIYFDHCEFDVNDDLLYYCWRRQVNVNGMHEDGTFIDYNNEHAKHVKDGRETTDWSRHTRLVQLNQHTKGEGKFKVNFSGLGYIDVDLEDGSFDRIMREGFNAILEKCPRFASHLDELDVYYMDYLSPHHEMYMYEWKDFGEGHATFDAAMAEHKTDFYEQIRTSWNMVTDFDETPYQGTGKESEYAVLTVNYRLAFEPGTPQINCTDGWNEKKFGNERNWCVDYMLNTCPDDNDKEYVYFSTTPTNCTLNVNYPESSIMQFLDMCFGKE